MDFDLAEWAREYLWAEVDAQTTGAPEWLAEVARGEGARFRRVLEAAEQEAGRHLPAGEASTIAEIARALLSEAA